MLIQRILTAVIGIPIAILLIYQGGWLLLVTLGIITTLGSLEYYRLLRNKGIQTNRCLGVIGSIGLLLAAAFLDYGNFTLFAVIMLILLSLILHIFQYDKINICESIMTIFGCIYVGLLFGFLYAIRSLPDGFIWLLLGIVCTWSSDTGAFFVGSKFGKHKLCPKVSPNKSIEGAIGGLCFSVAMAIFIDRYWLQIPLSYSIMLGIFISVFGQLGDLVESSIKRFAGVKDSGNILPGHGGILDRFDSMFFVMPVLYYFIIYVVQNA